MPRITNNTYLTRRRRLRRAWFGRRWAWGELELSEQYNLHRYFHPTKEWLDEAALSWRDAKTASDASLPQRAGRAYAKMADLLDHAEQPTHPRPVSYPSFESESAQAERQIWSRPPYIPASPLSGRPRVHAVVQPEVNVAQLVQALRVKSANKQNRPDLAAKQPDSIGTSHRGGKVAQYAHR